MLFYEFASRSTLRTLVCNSCSACYLKYTNLYLYKSALRYVRLAVKKSIPDYTIDMVDVSSSAYSINY